MSRRRDRLIQDSRSSPVGAASRALLGDAAGSAGAQDRSSGLLAAEIADVLERAGSFARGASELVAWELEPIAALGEMRLTHGEALVVFSTAILSEEYPLAA